MNFPVWLVMPAAVMLAGGALTFFWRPGKQLIGLVQHLAAGIIPATLMIVGEQRSEHSSMWAAIESIAPAIACTSQTLLERLKSEEVRVRTVPSGSVQNVDGARSDKADRQ